MLQATTGAQVFCFLHHSLESAGTPLAAFTHSSSKRAVHVNIKEGWWDKTPKGRLTERREREGEMEEMGGRGGDDLRSKEVRNDPKFSLSIRVCSGDRIHDVLSDLCYTLLKKQL